ncbi:MAG: hypothetical protein JSR66_28130 [Proteobacteria bacterium]|nr:hypothetical protein [Pseudomonadota bacterium]
MLPRNACVASAALLICTACGGGNSPSSGYQNPPPPNQSPPPPTYTVGGTVSGLRGSGLKLQNGTGHLSVAAAGAFTFPDPLAGGSAYAVSIETQPTNPAQTCTVANGSGTIGQANITNIAVTCATLETGRHWQTATALEQVAGVFDDSAGVAVNAHGKAVAAWRRQLANGLFQIWASRYSPGPGTWSAPVRIGPESGTGNFGASGPPTLAIADDGNTVVAWPQLENGIVEVFASQYTDAGGWGAATRVSSAGSPFAVNPSVVFDSNGNSLLTWEQAEGTSDHIQFSRLASGATTWSTPVQLDTAVTEAGSARLAADTNGNAVAIWVQDELVQGAFVSRIWSSTYTSAGTWSAPVLAGGDPNSQVSNDRVASNGAGIAQALWQQADGSLWSSRYTPGTGWDTAKQVEAAASGAGTAELTMDQNGNVLAVWQRASAQMGHIFYSRLSANDGWTAPAPVSPGDAGAAESSEFPKIAFDSQGEAIAVWTRLVGADMSARSALYTPATGWGDAVDIANSTNVVAATVAVAPDGTGIAVWDQAVGPPNGTALWSSRFE